MDKPYSNSANSSLVHKAHNAPVPAIGGIVLFLVGAILALTDVSLSPGAFFARPSGYLSVASAFGALMVMGFLDDRQHIRAIYRLLISAGVFLALLFAVPSIVLHEVYLKSFETTVGLGAWAVPFTLICLVGFQNAVNMVDGRNGLLLGLSIMWMGHLMAHAPADLMPIMAGFLSLLLVLFFFNVSGRIFMGDCGSYGLASFFGVAALSMVDRAVPGAEPLRSSGIVIMFLIPALDMVRVIFDRLLAGKSPFLPDTNHLHHLLDKSVGWTRGWWIYMSLAGLPLAVWHAAHQYAPVIVILNLAAYSGLIMWAKARVQSKAFEAAA